jgi:Acetylornithine deacetylase/Succinyl-diaminopimelate desuccinylase and related deacylases
MRYLLALFSVVTLAAQTPDQQLARSIFQELININTTDSVGDNTRAAEAMAARFRQAGYPDSDIHLLSPAPRKGNLVVRLRGTGAARPILFIGHLDVVEANRSDWSFDPFEFREQEGYFYGRGTQDMKGDDAILVAAFLRIKRERFQPSRDMILALTSDEEGGPWNGIKWLIENHRDLIDAAFCINPDGGAANIRNGRRTYLGMQAAEKMSVTFKLEVTNPGGHSSLPTKENAIYTLAAALTRLAQFDFPVHLFDVTRAGFERRTSIYAGQLASDMKAVLQNPMDANAAARLSAIPVYNSQLRTTCVATMLAGGHAQNALPQLATATVNCRILPVESQAEVEETLRRVIGDPKVKFSVTSAAKPSPPSSDPKILDTIATTASKFWPGVSVIPEMSTGATDGLYLRNAGIPTYGATGLFIDEEDIRAHGRDERVLVKSFYEAVDFMYALVTRLGSGN